MRNSLVLLLLAPIFLISCGKVSEVKTTDNAMDSKKQVVESNPSSSGSGSNTTDSGVKALRSKWSNSGLIEWDERSITNAIVLNLPKDSSTFSLHYGAESALKGNHKKEIGDFLGDILVTNTGANKLYGQAIVSIVTLKEDIALKDWIVKTSKEIHANYCKEFGTTDVRKEKDDGKCSDKINYLEELPKSAAKGDGTLESGFVWNNDFVGEPQIVSIKIQGYILSFELGQDQSKDFLDLVTDVAQAAR